MEIRNIAIIAHVDHGKTTLTDTLMRQTGMISGNESMDSNSIEQERGITIYSKNTSIFYRHTKINIVDTPGHADFSSEVERVLRSVDCVLLLVDVQDGPMPQTKFVLRKSLELGLKPIVVINKMDKPTARPKEVLELIYELFLNLGATDDQLDFPVVYASSKQGIAKLDPADDSENLNPLLDVILEKVKPASNKKAAGKSLAAQPFNLAYDNFLGRCAICRVYEGKIKTGQQVFVHNIYGESRQHKITKIFTFHGLEKKEVQEAVVGDIVLVAGLPDIYIGETISENADQPLLPGIKIDEPTISLNFLVNNSPLAGREGKFVTIRQLKERLKKELEVNVGLRIDFSNKAFYKVFGRGELHVAVLLENLRREGYELQISQPQVVIKEQAGVKLEPFEEVIIDVPENMVGVVIGKLSKRQERIISIKNKHNETRLILEIPTRGLLGYRKEFVVDTRGEGILCSNFLGFRPMVGEVKKSEVGAMISMATGKASAFALWGLQRRGSLYIGPNAAVYEGMVFGNTTKGNDMVANPTKGKQMSNMRSSGADDAIVLIPPQALTLENALSIMNDDEYLEVTPQNIRLRKQHLTENDRSKARKTVIVE